MKRIFLLSPANGAGKRAGYLMRTGASFDLARRLHTEGAGIGELYAFMSGLYFRGKLAYSTAFADPPRGLRGVNVIVPGVGLTAPDHVVDLTGLRLITQIPVDPAEHRYRAPLLHDSAELAASLGSDTEVVLLGSIATAKYLEPLQEVFGERLRFPSEFVGRGDMSRGSLMLRCVAEGRELGYVGVTERSRKGAA